MLYFHKGIPSKRPFEHPWTKTENYILQVDEFKLLQKNLIWPFHIFYPTWWYFLNLFTRKKKDNSYMTILNLKLLNKEWYTQNFQIESMRHVIHMIKPGIFLISLDIKNPSYSVPIHKEHRRLLKLLVKGKELQFNAIVNTYKDVKCFFSKILEASFDYLRKQELLHTISLQPLLT